MDNHMIERILTIRRVVRDRQLAAIHLICLLVAFITRRRLTNINRVNLPTRDLILHRKNVREELLNSLSSETCREHIRMSERAFRKLCKILEHDGGLRSTQRMSVEEHVARFLHMKKFEKSNSEGMTGQVKNGIPPKELLDDLCSRFVLNVPKEDQQSFERILFLVEYAHWFYEDNSVENNPSLKSFTLKEFTSLMFNSCDVLKPYVPHIDDIFKDFTSYKVRVPVTGAIILDQTYERCVLVKGWKGSSWSFPRGKKNKDEEDHKCAIREVLEETGFDVSELINKDEYVEMIFGPQRVRLYIVGGVKEDTTFAPQTKKEISEIAWQRVDDLRPVYGDVISHGVTGLKLYMVAPFLKALRSWISSHYPPVPQRSNAPARAKSVWKAKGNASGSSLVTTETQSSKSSHVSNSSNKGPGQSFRNFHFNTRPILQPIETEFSS